MMAFILYPCQCNKMDRVRVLHAPFRMIVAGPSSSGKTYFTYELVKNAEKMIRPKPKKIVWLYNNYQPLYDQMKGVEFSRGLSELKKLQKGNTHILLVIDDMMTQAREARDLFTRYSHHAKISVVFICQNLFYKGQGFRDMTLSASYIVIFKNPRDSSQISHLSRQMFPDKSRFLTEAYKKATRKPFSYIFIDLTQETDEKYRLRSKIFPHQKLTVYQE